MGILGISLALSIYFIGLIGFIFNNYNLIMLIIALELILLSIGILLVN